MLGLLEEMSFEARYQCGLDTTQQLHRPDSPLVNCNVDNETNGLTPVVPTHREWLSRDIPVVYPQVSHRMNHRVSKTNCHYHSLRMCERVMSPPFPRQSYCVNPIFIIVKIILSVQKHQLCLPKSRESYPVKRVKSLIARHDFDCVRRKRRTKEV